MKWAISDLAISDLEYEEIFLNFVKISIINESRQLQSNKGGLGGARPDADLARKKVEPDFPASQLILF